mmetsp:Transcript_14370/g.32276  ORF Transcript_14370/g.32276 Transcript_14370/m.32276 type:complete len:168 (-) Transcript_14370:515-1018(-)
MTQISLQTEVMKCWSCETTNTPPENRFSASASASIAPISRWLVGSSSSRMEGAMKSALASATLILHPPDISLVFLCTVAPPSESAAVDLNPRPTSMVEARLSKVAGSSWSCLSYRSISRLLSGPSVTNICSMAASSLSTSCLALFTTYSRADTSSGGASWHKRYTSK